MGDFIFVKGVKKGDDEALKEAIKRVFLKSTNNLSWLKKGQKVLLKPALNSNDCYPATTHPLCLKVISELLKKKGAHVIAGDQSGIEHVTCDEERIVYGSSNKCYEKSGMKKSKVDFVAFEDKGWEGFDKFSSQINNSAWDNGFFVTNVINEVDHIINLPRVSTHMMSGVSLGFKNFVGILRQDSRVEFHKDGPFFGVNKMYALRSKKLKTDYKTRNEFFKKITEISLAVKKKLRLTLFVATEMQCTFGPDKKILNFFKAYISRPQEGLVFASSNQVASEALALAFLTLEYKQVPFYKKFLNRFCITCNNQIKELGKEKLWENKFLKNALDLGLGNKKFKVKFENVSKELKSNLEEKLRE